MSGHFEGFEYSQKAFSDDWARAQKFLSSLDHGFEIMVNRQPSDRVWLNHAFHDLENFLSHFPDLPLSPNPALLSVKQHFLSLLAPFASKKKSEKNSASHAVSVPSPRLHLLGPPMGERAVYARTSDRE